MTVPGNLADFQFFSERGSVCDRSREAPDNPPGRAAHDLAWRTGKWTRLRIARLRRPAKLPALVSASRPDGLHETRILMG